MDLTKLLGMLESKKLFLPRSDQFDDPYEGCLPKAAVAQNRAQYLSTGIPPKQVDIMIDNAIKAADIFRKQMFISCWYSSEYESAAMWKLYLQSSEGIAIRSDHDALCRSLIASPLMARTANIKYIDYDKTPIPAGNIYFQFLHKRLSFSHENELRAVIWSKEDVNGPQIPAEAISVTVDVDPSDLIKAVHVSPTSPKWFGELVEHLLKRYGLKCPVEKSALYDRPSY
jgi:hypothetical protein